MRFDAGADRHARLDLVIVEVHGGRGDNRIAVVVDTGTEAGNRPGGFDLAHGEAAGDIGHHVGSDGRADTAAQRREPIELLVTVECRADGCVEADECGIAQRGRTAEFRVRLLGGERNVALDACHQPRRCHPVVAALQAADHAAEIVVRGAACEQRRTGRHVAEHRVGPRFAHAVADVGAEIRAGPGPGDGHRRAERRLQRQTFGNYRCCGREHLVTAKRRIEFVVHARAQDVVGDMGIAGKRDRRRV